MEIVINLDKEDWKKFVRYLGRELSKANRSCGKDFFFAFFYWMIVGLIILLMQKFVGGFHWPTAGIAFVVFVFILLFLIIDRKRNKNPFEPSAEGMFVGEHKFIFDERGAQMQGKGYESKYIWTAFKKIERAQGMILIYVDTAMAFIFPETKLSNPDEFYNFIAKHYSKAMGGQPLE